MTDRAEAGGGFTVLDGAALVTGAAVALVHLRSAVTEFDDALDWVWASCLFSWLGVTAAGPFVYLGRRFFSRPPGYPRLGDRLWALSGSPWFLAAVVKTGDPASEAVTSHVDPAYVGCLGIGLTLVALVAVPVLARKYLLVDPVRPMASAEPSPWTDRLGLLLTVAWPLQCGVGLVVMG